MDPIIAIAQFPVGYDKQTNINFALRAIENAHRIGANFLLLPEMFNCPYKGSLFREYSEPPNSSNTLTQLENALKSNPLYLIAGSIPEYEAETDTVFNTSFIFNPKGEKIGSYRKMHLFDVDLETVSIKESSHIGYGNSYQVFETPNLTFGVIICYDIRFGELARSLTLAGTECLFVPAAFSMETGTAHWHMLMRSRAVDNQIYVCASCPTPTEEISYKYYSHSLMVDPFGVILVETEKSEDLIFSTFSKDRLNDVRHRLPLLNHRRPEMYRLK